MNSAPPRLLRRPRATKPVPSVPRTTTTTTVAVSRTTTVAVARKRPRVQAPDPHDDVQNVVQALVPFLESVEDVSSIGKWGKGKGTIFPAFEMDSVYDYIIPELNQLNERVIDQWLNDPSSAPNGVRPSILSIFAVLTLGQQVDLDEIAQVANDVTYDPNGFSFLVLRNNELNAIGMVFASGIMVVSGCQTETNCNTACEIFVETIRRAQGHSTISSNLAKTQTITASCNIGFKIRTEHLAKDPLMRPFTVNDPLSFTGVSIQLVIPRAKVVTFANGSVIISGCRSQEEVDEAFKIIYPHLKTYAV